MPSACQAVVIGGGLAGLAASIALAGRGVRVSLLEKHPRLGGRATSYQLPTGEYIDNCQHVTLRCCTNVDDFYQRLGVAGKIQYYDRLMFADAKGGRAEIRSRRLPAPFHLAQSFAAFPLLNWKDKAAIAFAMLRIMRNGGLPPPHVTAGAGTMLDWLKQNYQTQTAIDRFWRVVLVSALNEQLDRMDAGYGIAVFWKAFLSNPAGFGIGVPAAPLELLYASASECIRLGGGDVHPRCGAAELRVSDGAVTAVRLDDGTELKADYYIAAVPFDRLLKILPVEARDSEPFLGLAKLGVSPITSVHLWFDRSVMVEPFLASLDSTVRWVFNKTMQGSENSAQTGQYIQAVVSASHEFSRRSQDEIVAICRRDLDELIPATADATLMRAVVIRENAATFSPQPGCDKWRPSARTPLQNLFLAGDWTSTGWPATMESAVRSGYRAAETVLAAKGQPVQLVRPELPVTGLARFFART